MTHHLDVALRRDLAARWCALAEQRLRHLTELFESGRWRRYYSQTAFLENIREAKKAVEAWQALSGRPTARDDGAALIPRPTRGIEAVTPAIVPSLDVSLAESDFDAPEPEEVHSAPVDLDALERALTAPRSAFELGSIEQRYPLLHNAL